MQGWAPIHLYVSETKNIGPILTTVHRPAYPVCAEDKAGLYVYEFLQPLWFVHLHLDRIHRIRGTYTYMLCVARYAAARNCTTKG
ncbi:hypothetical protein AZ09_03845 [Acetobacter aceti 1023]|nr:hypothetical protein AZ09_03845 [Acetobacter aceti 1023]